MKNRCLQIRIEEGKSLQLVTGKACTWIQTQ
jgi:hypothetical protein